MAQYNTSHLQLYKLKWEIKNGNDQKVVIKCDWWF